MELKTEINKKKTQMLRGVLEMCVLGIISEGEVYSSDIISRLRSREILKEIKEGTLYPLLTRLKNAGLVEYLWRESEGGPPRKYYQISEHGKDFLAGLLITWRELNQVVEQSTEKFVH